MILHTHTQVKITEINFQKICKRQYTKITLKIKNMVY